MKLEAITVSAVLTMGLFAPGTPEAIAL